MKGLVSQSDSIVEECLRFVGDSPGKSELSSAPFLSRMKAFGEQGVRNVTRARMAAYEVGESYLMWRSLWPSSMSIEYAIKK